MRKIVIPYFEEIKAQKLEDDTVIAVWNPSLERWEPPEQPIKYITMDASELTEATR